MSQQAITQAIYERLTADQAGGSLYAMLAGRIHHLRAPDQTALPWLSFTLTQDQPQAYFTQADDLELRLDIHVWSRAEQGVQAAQLISDALRSLLHRQPLSVAGMSRAEVVCLDRGVARLEDLAIRIQSQWRVWGSLE